VTFERPWLLLGLLAIPAAAVLYVLFQRRRARYTVRFTNVDVLAPVVAGRSWRRWVAPGLLALALSALVVAVARPEVRAFTLRERATVVLVIDVSGSMEAKDVKPSRLQAAQRAIRHFLELVPQKLRVGMVAFAGEPHVAAPPSTDRRLVRESLRTLHQYPSFGGTAIGDALAMAVDLGQDTLARDVSRSGEAPPPAAADGDEDTRRLVSILFLSDGAQRRGILPPLEGAERAKAAGMPVYAIALGTPNGTIERNWGGGFGGTGGGGLTIPVPPDPETLKAIAELTGGEFFNATNAKALGSAYEKLGSNLGRRRAWREVSNAFSAGAAFFLVAAGAFAGLWSPRIP
jgi:Ca-activated chloride channel family protein